MTYTNFNNLINIREAVQGFAPTLIDISDQKQAAVSVVLRKRNAESELLFIQRATAEEDPWSGQIAFPGGGKEPFDRTLSITAKRETREETGIDLDAALELGRLDDHQGQNKNRSLNLVISCYVYQHDKDQPLRPNYEVAEAFWVPLSILTDPTKALQYQTEYRNDPFPGIDLGVGNSGQERILWGLTYRFTQQFLSLLS